MFFWTSEAGVSITEVLLASFILTVALLSVALTMAQGISAINIGQQQLIAKQKAQEALESVIMARNTQDIGFTQTANAADGGVFVAGYTGIVGMGLDGIPNTGDDTGTVESLTFSGPDGNLGNSDDVTRPRVRTASIQNVWCRRSFRREHPGSATSTTCRSGRAFCRTTNVRGL